MLDAITIVITNSVSGILTYLPQLFGGLLILLIGLLIAAALKKGVSALFRALRVEKWMEEAGVAKGKSVQIWVELFAELVRWTIIVLFLIPAAEIWGIPRVTNVLNQLLLYVPNVFIAAIVGLVGAVAANFVSDIIRHGSTALGSKSANAIASIAYSAIIFFTVLIVLNQLGVASDLVRILFTGIVAMLAIAGGLAFGLGGKDMAHDILDSIRRKLK